MPKKQYYDQLGEGETPFIDRKITLDTPPRPDRRVQVIFRLWYKDLDMLKARCALEKQTMQNALEIFSRAYSRENKELMKFMRRHAPAREKKNRRRTYSVDEREAEAIFKKLEADSPLEDAFITVDQEYMKK